MTHDGRRSYSRNSNRIVRCLLGWTVGVVLATGPVEAGPVDQTTTDASVTAGARQSSSFSERRARWLAISSSIDSRKFERIWLCMRFKDAPMDFPDALNICEPCVSALATAGVRPAVLTEREKSCIKRGGSDGSGGDAGQDAGAGKYDAAVNPQCSGTNPNDPRADARGNTTRPWTRAEIEAHRELEQARAEARRANAQVRNAEADVQYWRQEVDRHPSRANREHLNHATHGLNAARARQQEAQERREAAEDNLREAHTQAQAEWERRHDPAVGPAGEREPGTGYEDPRCQGQRQAAAWGAPWSDVCRGEDGHLVDFKECHRRMTDPVYAATGGRCWEEPGPADGVRKVCKEQDAGRQEPGNTPGGAANPGPVDPIPWKRPTVSGAGAGPVPSPVQTLRDQMCAKGRCPDPLPFNAAVPQASNGNSRWSNSVPPGQGPSTNMTQRPMPSTGMTQRPAPSTGMMQRPAPSTGMMQRPAPSTGTMQRPATYTGMMQRPAARVGTMQGQVPSAVTTRPNQLRQNPSLKISSFNGASAAKPGLNGLRASH
jgi:hypothetical protein